MITASRIAFAIRTEQSPLTPSFIEPITAIAPIQTVQEALTNADTNEASPVLWLLILRHSPSLSTRAFILIISPIRLPKEAYYHHNSAARNKRAFRYRQHILHNAAYGEHHYRNGIDRQQSILYSFVQLFAEQQSA